MQDNTYEIAEAIFTKPPGDLNTIDLSLEEETAEIANQDGVEVFVVNILRLITLHGIKILFGHNNLLNLSDEQIILIKRYTRSYGYNLVSTVQNGRIYITFERAFI